MASKLSFLNSLTERNKPKEGTDDELAIVKAAAWAWHQHGSGSEGKITSEFFASRTRHIPPRPSRYKLEAVRLMADKEAKEGSPPKEKSLLDAYEVQSISRHLNSLILESNKGKHVKSVDKYSSSVDIGGGRKMEKKKVKKKEKMRKGFWLRHGPVCGREEDVVDPIALRDGHHRRSINQVKLPISRGGL